MANIRNFCIIAHIDHGKSTLADRMLELTHTIEQRKMREQFLDMHPLERERGITIKMQPVRMLWKHSYRGTTRNETQNNAEFLYSDLTYKIRRILFEIRKKIGLGHKEQIYHNALEIELKKTGLKFESKKNIPINYDGKKIGLYQPDFVVEDKVLIELKALPEIGKPQTEQLWTYLKGCDYKLALLVNFGSKDLQIKRVVYDTARHISASSASGLRDSAGAEDQIQNYVLNLIDTPGHIDFNYEVSRALAAVEGAVLLVDATQGVEAQTLSNVELARQLNLAIIPVINKIDLPNARIAETKKEIVNILNCAEEDILSVSARTGEGVGHLLEEIVRRMPPPRNNTESTLNIAEEPRALIFDYEYSIHRGVIAHVRVFEGEIKKGDRLKFFQAKEDFIAGEVGIFKPELKETEKLSAGEIGYVITNAKEANIVRVGDTIIKNSNSSPLPGYKEIKPVVFSSVYPMNQNEFPDLKKALEKIRLIDSAFSFEEESAGVLGRGFRCGFLGMLHLEIVSERIFRDYGIKTIVATPTVKYKIKIKKGGEQKEIEIYTPSNFPERHEILEILEPYLKLEILMPPEKLPNILKLLQEHEAILGETHKFSESRIRLSAEMPLRELMRNFFDELKSFSSGYASLNYEFIDSRPADLLRLDILVNEEAIPAFARIVPKKRVEHEAEEAVEKLYKILPHALFALKIQAKADGRIISARSLKALSKDVTGYLYGGDRTRKMKLWQKQKKGKKRLKERADFEIPHDVYLKMIKK